MLKFTHADRGCLTTVVRNYNSIVIEGPLTPWRLIKNSVEFREWVSNDLSQTIMDITVWTCPDLKSIMLIKKHPGYSIRQIIKSSPVTKSVGMIVKRCSNSYYRIVAWTKKRPFCRWHFQMCHHQWKSRIFIHISLKVCFQWSNWLSLVWITVCHRKADKPFTETKMSSFWRNFNHWLHWKLSFWQLPVQPVMKISSKWRHFRFSVIWTD